MSNFKKAKSYAAALCSSSERCSFDVYNRLLTRELSMDEVDEIIAFLIKEKYLDDNRFAEFYTLDKFKFNKWGKIKIRMMLSQKQIASNVIDKVLALIPKEEYMGILESEILLKAKSLYDEEPFMKKMKLARFASSRGYDQDEIFKVLNEHFES